MASGTTHLPAKLQEGIFVLDAKAAQNRAGGKGNGKGNGKFYI